MRSLFVFCRAYVYSCDSCSSFVVCHTFVICCSFIVARDSLFVVCCSSFVVRSSSFIHLRSSLVVCRWLLIKFRLFIHVIVIRRSMFVVRHVFVVRRSFIVIKIIRTYFRRYHILNFEMSSVHNSFFEIPAC